MDKKKRVTFETVISEETLLQKKDHYQVHQWPDEKQLFRCGFRHTLLLSNTYFIRIISKTNLVKFEICPIVDFYGEITYSQIRSEACFEVKVENFNYFLHLISKEYKNQLLLEQKKLIEQKSNEFYNKLNDQDLLIFFTKFTKDYIEDLFENNQIFNIININSLAVSGLPNCKQKLHDLNNDLSSEMDHECMVFELYPILSRFSVMLLDCTEGYDDDNIFGSLIAELNAKYVKQLRDYCKKL